MAAIKSQAELDQFGRKKKKKKDETVVENPPQEVSYKNEIARARNTFTLEEAKVFHLVLSKIDAMKSGNDPIVKLDKKEMFESLGLVGTSRYKRYKAIFIGLSNKTRLNFIDADGSEYQGRVIVGTRWHRKSTAPIEVSLDPLLMPYIENLAITGGYTKLFLDSVLKFKSEFSLRLYVFLKSWRSAHYENARHLTTLDLKNIFGLNEGAYTYNGVFKRGVFESKTLNVALKEINETTELRVEIKKEHEKGSVKSYVLHWIDSGQLRANIDKDDGQMTIDDFIREE